MSDTRTKIACRVNGVTGWTTERETDGNNDECNS